MADREKAGGAIGLVQAFVNTVDLESGPEELTDPGRLAEWLATHALLAAGASADEADLAHAIALREALRAVIGANSGGSV